MQGGNQLIVLNHESNDINQNGKNYKDCNANSLIAAFHNEYNVMFNRVFKIIHVTYKMGKFNKHRIVSLIP